jgi:kynurenine formamidase
MLSRRSLLVGGAVAGAALASGVSLAPTPARARTLGGSVSDLTHPLSPEFPTFFGVPGISLDQKFNWADNKFNLFEITFNEHTGTHMDAPLHFSENGNAVHEVPVENLVAPLVVIDIAAKAAEDPDAQVTPDDIKAWTDANGELPEGCCVAMYSGWGEHVATPKFRNADEKGTMHFPGFHVEAAQMLIENGRPVGIAVDTLSLDHGPSPDFATHYAWLPTNRWGLECVAGLGALPRSGATIVVGAPKHVGGSGGPSRVFAFS